MSTVLWVGIFLVPFAEGPATAKAAAAAALYAVSWVLLVPATWLLGRETMDRMHSWTRQRIASLRIRGR